MQNAVVYRRTRQEMMSFANALYKDQWWYELSGQEESLKLVRESLAIPDYRPLCEDLVDVQKELSILRSGKRELVRKTRGLTAFYWTVQGIDWAATAASLASGFGALKVALRGAGPQILKMIAAKAALQTGAAALSGEVASRIASASGADSYEAEQARAAALGVFKLWGLSKALLLAIRIPSVPRVPMPNALENPNQKLSNIISNLWRRNAAVGCGSSMDAVRFTRITGIPVGPGTGTHVQKMIDTRNALLRWYRANPNASPELVKQVTAYLDDVLDVLRGQ